MKRTLESPKIIVYKNIDKVEKILEKYYGEDSDNFGYIARTILDTFNIPYGKKTVVEVFQNNVQAVLEDGKITLQLAK